MKRARSIILGLMILLLIPSGTSAFGLVPASIELTASRGETIEASITILNTQDADTEYFLGLMGFQPKDDSGSPEFFTPIDGVSGLTDWIVFESGSVIVPALSSAEVPFKVVVPDDIAAQSYFAAITVSPAPSDVVATNGAIIEAKTASLLFLTVEGETVERLELLDFTSTNGFSDLPFRTYTYRIQNQGNVHLSPTGFIRLTGLFGQTISNVDANPEEGRVLPDSTRTFEVTQENALSTWYDTVAFQLSHLAIGPVTATLDLTYGESGTIQSSLSFWLFPWQLMVTLLGLLIVLCILYRFLQRRRHS